MIPSLKKDFILAIFLFPILFLGCDSTKNNSELLTCRVRKGPFINSLIVNGELKAKKTVTISCPDIWPAPKIKKLVPEGTFVQADEVVCELDAAELLLNYQKAKTELENAHVDFSKTKAELQLQRTLLESQMKSIDASTQISRLQLPQLEYVSPMNKKIIELKIQRSEVEKNKIIDKLKSLEKIQRSDLKKMEMKIKQAENKVSRAQMYLDRLILRAPLAGILIYKFNWATKKYIAEGDNVRGGMPVLEIPEISCLQVKIAAGEANVKKIKKNQLVKINVDANPEIKLTGHVSRVAQVGKPIRGDWKKIKIFEVLVDVDSTDFLPQPGLNTTCEIMIESIPDTISVPNICLFQSDSTKFVYCREGKFFCKQLVETGLQNENYSIISSGLKGGEILALVQPGEHLLKP